MWLIHDQPCIVSNKTKLDQVNDSNTLSKYAYLKGIVPLNMCDLTLGRSLEMSAV